MSKAARFFEMKRQGQPISMLTAYDFPTARAEAEAGVDIILVGDSVGTNILGYASEREVTVADICHHTRAVRRGAPASFIMSDLPYQSYETSEMALRNAKLLLEAGADMVKFEGPHPQIMGALVSAGIETCGHLGLEPQHHEEKRLKGRTAIDAAKLVADAVALDKAGMSMLILELIPEELGERITKSVKAPTVGIGGGRKTDGQVLVVTDVLGYVEANFRHNRRYQEIGKLVREASERYVQDVRSGSFPAEGNVFHMPKEELAIFEGQD
jgi:3-methyl-2-oxobutanoate hydroxymethyltransferase